MKKLAAIFIVFALPLAAQEKDDNEELRKLQGKWLLQQMEADGTPLRIIKHVTGTKEKVSVYRGANMLIHEHVVNFEIKKTDHVTIFTYRNQRITAGPNKGVVREGPFSYVYQIKGNQWFVIEGIMNGDQTPLRVEWFERIKDVDANEPQTANAADSAEVKKMLAGNSR